MKNIILLCLWMACSSGVLGAESFEPGLQRKTLERQYKIKNKVRTTSDRLRRFLKKYGREIAAVVAGGAVGGLGAGFLTHYYDAQKIKKNDDAHAAELQQLMRIQEAERKALTDDFLEANKLIQQRHDVSLKEKDAALQQAAAEYQRQLDIKDKANEEEVERLRQTFEIESRQAQDAMAAKVAELEAALAERNKEQAAQLERYNQEQIERLASYQTAQMERLDGLKTRFDEFNTESLERADDLKEAFRRSSDEQKQQLQSSMAEFMEKQNAILEEVDNSRMQLQADFKRYMSELGQNFNQARQELQQQLAWLSQLSAYGIWQAQGHAVEVQQKLEMLNTEHQHAKEVAVAQHRAQQTQLAQMEQQAQQQRDAIAQLGEQGRRMRVTQDRSLGGDSVVAEKKTAVIDSLRDGYTNPKEYKTAGLTGGYKGLVGDRNPAARWQKQEDGTYKKVGSQTATPLSPAPLVKYSRDAVRAAAEDAKAAVIDSLRDGYTQPSQYKTAGLTGGYKGLVGDRNPAARWQKQEDGTYKKVSSQTATPLSPAPSVKYPRDAVRAAAEDAKDAEARKQMAQRRETVLQELSSRTPAVATADTRLPAMRTGGSGLRAIGVQSNQLALSI